MLACRSILWNHAETRALRSRSMKSGSSRPRCAPSAAKIEVGQELAERQAEVVVDDHVDHDLTDGKAHADVRLPPHLTASGDIGIMGPPRVMVARFVCRPTLRAKERKGS
jgi:hypothetical protein